MINNNKQNVIYNLSPTTRRSGFTIVELLVVIVVIGILAAITIVSYTGITSRANTSALQSDLANASQQLKLFQIDNSNYPATISTDCATQPDSVTNKCLKASPDTTYKYAVNNNSSPQTFSLYAIKNNTKYRITNDSSPIVTPTVIATGGNTVTDIDGYRIHKFTTSGTFTVTSGDNVEVLVVGGGGGGGSSCGGGGGAGGGGAGGLMYDTSFSVASGSITVTVGNGGAPGGVGLSQSGSNGGNSIFGSITATGGGFGANNQGVNGGGGGSGGGGGFNGYATVRLGGNGTSGQGNAGGNTSMLSWAGGAGGGGSGGIGGDNKINHAGGSGGPGLAYSISGSPVTYSVGGLGGGNSTVASPINTGKGGDAAYADLTAYAGGSGVVIVRYPL